MDESVNRSGDVESQKCDETSALLQIQKGTKSPPKSSGRKWKNLTVAICLLTAYFFASMAYSLLGPFFPEEVGTCMYKLVHCVYTCMTHM